MKRIFVLFALLLTGVFGILAQEVPTANFDERVDILCAVWRLSGAHEYNLCQMSSYAVQVDQYFAAYKDYPVVKMAKACAEYGIGYDAVVSFGQHIRIAIDGTISLDNRFKKGGDDSFDRWSDQQKNDFWEPLSDFYRQSQFNKWYEGTEKVRRQAIASFEENISKYLDMNCFDTFWGQRSNSVFDITLSILIGPHNYGCSAEMTDGSARLSPDIGSVQSDKHENPFYRSCEIVLPIGVHEFCHAYRNPLNLLYYKGLSAMLTSVFKKNANMLHSMAYGSPEMMQNETFVRDPLCENA